MVGGNTFVLNSIRRDFQVRNWLQLGDVVLNDYRVGQNSRLIKEKPQKAMNTRYSGFGK